MAAALWRWDQIVKTFSECLKHQASQETFSHRKRVCVHACVSVVDRHGALCSILCALLAPQRSVHLVLYIKKQRRSALPDWMTTFRIYELWFSLFALFFPSFVLSWSFPLSVRHLFLWSHYVCGWLCFDGFDFGCVPSTVCVWFLCLAERRLWRRGLVWWSWLCSPSVL